MFSLLSLHYCIKRNSTHCCICKATAIMLFSLFGRPIFRLIKLTSPNLNYIIGAGAILLYVEIYILVAHTTDRTVVKWLCNVSAQLCEGVTYETCC